MRQNLNRFIKSGLYILIALGLSGLVYFFYSYSHYSRLVDQRLEAGAFARTIDIYAQRLDQPEFIINLSTENRMKRRLVRFDEIPETLVRAVLLVEDKRFFSHAGLDFRRIAKAAYANFTTGRKGQGASTINMQLARSLWLDRRKTWGRKIAEAMIAIRLEEKLKKTEIFELYANEVDLGQQGTFNVRGFGEAAQAFFGKDIRDLTLAESAMLAGLIQQPGSYNPIRHPNFAQSRRNLVLQLMHNNGYINDADYRAALDTPVETVSHPELESFEAPYFVDLMKQELQSRMPDSLSDHRYRINTTLDLQLQDDADEAVRIGMQEVKRRLQSQSQRNEDSTEPQVALIALDPHTGEIKALVGGRNYRDSQLNRAISQRQPGSVFKPFVYAAGLEKTLKSPATNVTPATVFNDEPTTFSFDRQSYAPNNYGHTFSGEVTLRTALAKSMNIVTVQLAQLIGYDTVVGIGRAAGLSGIQPTPAVALGAYDATPLEMAGAYTVFANGGTYVEPHFISDIEDEHELTLYTSSPERRRVLDPRVAYQMVDLLQEVLQTGTGAGVRSRGLVVPAAGKTGTSRDGWFAGFISNLLCLVWVGFDDHRDLHLGGAQSALPIWTEFMKRAVQHGASAKPFQVPPGLIAVPVDPLSGQIATPFCESSRLEFFVPGTEPQQPCTLHQMGPAVAEGESAAP